MAQRNAGEHDSRVLAWTIHAEAWRAGQLRLFDFDAGRHAGQLIQQSQHVFETHRRNRR